MICCFFIFEFYFSIIRTDKKKPNDILYKLYPILKNRSEPDKLYPIPNRSKKITRIGSIGCYFLEPKSKISNPDVNGYPNAHA